MSAELWTPLEHMTVAPERSVGVSVVTVEIRGNVDVRLNWYTTPVPSLVAYWSCPTESVRE